MNNIIVKMVPSGLNTEFTRITNTVYPPKYGKLTTECLLKTKYDLCIDFTLFSRFPVSVGNVNNVTSGLTFL